MRLLRPSRETGENAGGPCSRCSFGATGIFGKAARPQGRERHLESRSGLPTLKPPEGEQRRPLDIPGTVLAGLPAYLHRPAPCLSGGNCLRCPCGIRLASCG